MPDYSKTVIYKIQHEDNESLVYVGSTTDFTKRKSHHKSNCNNPNVKNYNLKLYKMIRDNGGWNYFKMIQIKEYPCENRRQAETEEDKIMLELKANMNMNRASRSHKEWYEDNKERRLQKDKQYYHNNKEKILDYQKQFRENNKEQIIDYKKQYYKLNKETLMERVTCECGCVVNKMGLLRHKKTKKHIELLNETTEQ